MAKPNSLRLFLLCLIVCSLNACAIQADYIDGSLSASEGLASIKMAHDARNHNDSERYKQLDAVLSTSNQSIANLNGQDWCDFFNGIHTLASDEESTSGSTYERIVREQTDYRKPENDRSSNFGQLLFGWLMRVITTSPQKPIDHRALDYAIRLYRKSIVIGIPVRNGYSMVYSSDFKHLADCYLTAGNKIEAEKTMDLYRANLASKEQSKCWTIQINALNEDARLLENENKLPEAEQKLKLALSICESHEDLSPSGLEKMRQENIQWQKKYPGSGSGSTLSTCMALKELADFYNRTGHPQQLMSARKRLQELDSKIGNKSESF